MAKKTTQQIYGGSTFSFMWREPALAAMRRMRALGLNDFDILAVPGHFWPDELDAGGRRALAAALRADDIRVESVNIPALDQNLGSCIADARAYAVNLYRRLMEFGAELGARGAVVVPGRVSALLPPNAADTQSWLADSVAKLLEAARQFEQTIYLESHPQTSIPTAEKIAAFIDKFDDARLLVAYDVASAEFIGEDQSAALRLLGHRVGQTHLSDSTRAAWRHDKIGLGSVDFAPILSAIDEIGFTGVNILEIISADPVADIGHSMKALGIGR